jgi:hypothetical protein
MTEPLIFDGLTYIPIRHTAAWLGGAQNAPEVARTSPREFSIGPCNPTGEPPRALHRASAERLGLAARFASDWVLDPKLDPKRLRESAVTPDI